MSQQKNPRGGTRNTRPRVVAVGRAALMGAFFFVLL